jgi:hypothetical protein
VRVVSMSIGSLILVLHSFNHLMLKGAFGFYSAYRRCICFISPDSVLSSTLSYAVLCHDYSSRDVIVTGQTGANRTSSFAHPNLAFLLVESTVMSRVRAGAIQRLLHPKAKVNFHEEYLLDLDSDSYASLRLDLDEQAQENYRKLQDHERKAMAVAKAENTTYNNSSGVYLLNLRVLGLFYIMVHADFCRRSLQDVPIALLTAEIKHALDQADPYDAELLFELGKTIRWLVTMCALSFTLNVFHRNHSYREDASTRGDTTTGAVTLAGGGDGRRE